MRLVVIVFLFCLRVPRSDWPVRYFFGYGRASRGSLSRCDWWVQKEAPTREKRARAAAVVAVIEMPLRRAGFGEEEECRAADRVVVGCSSLPF